MNNKKICTNWQECKTADCPHNRPHNEYDSCYKPCITENSMCVDEIKLLRKQKLEKLNQNYEV